jgi:uncharacterized integral membrane protein
MKRLLFACAMAFLFFVLLNFVYCNLDSSVFGYRVVFKFSIPYLLSVQSVPLPMGFVMLVSFTAGMVAIALLEALPSFFKTLEIRSKNRKIRQLERELDVVRKMSDRPAATEAPPAHEPEAGKPS